MEVRLSVQVEARLVVVALTIPAVRLIALALAISPVAQVGLAEAQAVSPVIVLVVQAVALSNRRLVRPVLAAVGSVVLRPVTVPVLRQSIAPSRQAASLTLTLVRVRLLALLTSIITATTMTTVIATVGVVMVTAATITVGATRSVGIPIILIAGRSGILIRGGGMVCPHRLLWLTPMASSSPRKLSISQIMLA